MDVIKTVKRVAIGVGAFIVLTVGWFSFTETIQQGHVGVVYSRSHGVEKQTLGEGLKFVNPMTRITQYPVSTETVTSKETVSTKDGKTLDVKVTYEYHNDATKVADVYRKFRGQTPEAIESSWLKARLNEATLQVTSQYSVLEVFQNHEKIRTEIQNVFKDDIKEYGFDVEKVNFGTPIPDSQTAQAIQNVVNAQQGLEQLRIQKQQAQLSAEKKKIEADGKAQAQIAEAKGEAESTLLKAQAQAKANKELQASLTDRVLEYQKLNKWNGANSQTVLGNQGVNVNVK
jgi:regulator of protease activity HflC (stomatin/prohibitin superfamily)